MGHCIMPWTVLSVVALCITSAVTVNITVNQTDSPSVNNTNVVNVTEETTLGPYSTSTQSDFFETTTEQLLTETSPGITDSTPTDSTSTDFSTTESTTSNTPTLPTVPPECLCDITPNFCDIGCCCDNLDCEIDDLSSVFSDCKEETSPPGVCIEKWLMFRANVDPKLITVTDTLFCVQEEEKATEQQTLPARSERQQNKVFPSFQQEDDTSDPIVKDFYKVDDMILIQYNRISMLGTLKQPSPGVASSLCVDLNPARFLRSTTHSCSRTLSAQSCSTDHRLNVHSYYKDISLLRVPNPANVDISDLLIPIIPVTVWEEPSEENGTCLNVVSKVEYIVEFSHAGEITSATLRANFLNSSLDQPTQILQEFSVTFQLATAGPTPAPLPTMGLIAGNPVLGQFGEEISPLTILAPAAVCSVPLAARVPIHFTHNSISGCSFRSASQNCSELRSEMYTVLTGMATPDMVAMGSGSLPDWAAVITEDCPESQAEGSCATGCFVPQTLSIQFLWAKRGLLSLPQNYILGAKYQFSCQKIKCPLASSLAVTSKVTFSEITAYPEPPRGVPQPHWKFPFSFFFRGQEEFDIGQ